MKRTTTIDQEELLEHEADIARHRLLDTVDELEARKDTLEQEATSLLPIAAGALGAVWLSARVGKRVKRWNLRRHRRARWRRLLRAVRLR
jgi:hypothetical protein